MYTRDGQTSRHELRPGDTTVGRAPICDLTIDDPSISRRHVRFRVHGDHCVLTDLGGRNGTFLNGEQVTEAEVRGGDSVVLGRLPIHIEHGDPQPLVLSDQHALIESDDALYRRVDDDTETLAGSRVAAHPERLLLLLSEMARQLVGWRSLPETLDRIVSVAFETISVDRAFLLLVDERTGEIVPRVARTRGNRPTAKTTLSRKVIRKAVHDRVAMLARDAHKDSRMAGVESLVVANIRSFMCTPLWTNKRVVGVLYVDNPISAQLSAADLDILQALGSYAAVLIEQTLAVDRRVEDAVLWDRLLRHHSPAVVERLLAGGHRRALDGTADERELTVLFADIVGFSSRAGQMPASEAAQLLSQCLSVMSEAVFAEEGALDKFIGDAVLALFGAPFAQPDHAARALRSAEAMRQAVAAIPADPPIRLRIAIDSGMAAVGEVGPARRKEYAVLGDVVNTCSRLVESTCEPGRIVLSDGTRRRLGFDPGMRALGPVRIPGRSAPVEVFEVVTST